MHYWSGRTIVVQHCDHVRVQVNSFRIRSPILQIRRKTQNASIWLYLSNWRGQGQATSRTLPNSKRFQKVTTAHHDTEAEQHAYSMLKNKCTWYWFHFGDLEANDKRANAFLVCIAKLTVRVIVQLGDSMRSVRYQKIAAWRSQSCENSTKTESKNLTHPRPTRLIAKKQPQAPSQMLAACKQTQNLFEIFCAPWKDSRAFEALKQKQQPYSVLTTNCNLTMVSREEL